MQLKNIKFDNQKKNKKTFDLQNIKINFFHFTLYFQFYMLDTSALQNNGNTFDFRRFVEYLHKY